MKPSPSMVVAIAALVVALSGGAYAASGLVTSSQIKNGTIQPNDLAPSVNAKINRRLVAGPRGPQGPAGAPGVAVQAAGGTGVAPEKIIYVEGADTLIPVGQVASAEARCPAGTKAIGGGGFNSITNLAAGGVIGSGIGQGNGWYIVVNNQTTIDVSVNAFAICVAP